MTTTIEFFVPGDPKGQPRARAFAMNRGGKTMVRMYDPATAEGWKNAIAMAAKAHCPFPALLGPLRISEHFVFARPRSHFRTGRFAGVLRDDAPYYHVGKPDRDNLDKAVLDALKMLGFFKDDCQVCSGELLKTYGDKPGCSIRIDCLSDAFARAQESSDPGLGYICRSAELPL
jgi:Holliday junction resolvase RusA-like endonuclease